MIEALFPQTIDKLNKESSKVDGPKPLLLSNQHMHLFNTYLTNAESLGKTQGKVEFGCDQVVIVRNQESKAKIPLCLRYAVALTIQ